MVRMKRASPHSCSSFVRYCTALVRDAASAIFRNAFYGSDLAEDWRRQLRSAAAVAAQVAAYELTMPEGLPALEGAAGEIVRRGSLA